jgi:3-oxoacyl-[acyl-carrier protein] reductase
MELSLSGRSALVTGASRGIGRAIAERLARSGAVVAVHYGSNREAAEHVVATITSGGGRAFCVGAELDRLSELDALFDGLARGLRSSGGDGLLDILVNNAGIGRSRGIVDVDQAEFDRLFAVNVRAPLFIVQRALGMFRDGGRIINISSGVVRIAVPEMVAYSMTKGAIEVMTRTLALQLGPRRITVNAVAPGVIDTDVNASWLRDDPAGEAIAAAMSALGRVGQAEDVANIVAMLASAEAGWITGDTIDATGGCHL